MPVHELAEWETRELEGVYLTDGDRSLVESLRQRRRVLEIDELRSGLRIKARSHVGVVRFEDLEVRVVPKLAGDALGLVRMLEFTSGLEALRRLDAERLLSAEGTGLFDLISLLYVEAVSRLLRGGLLEGYVEREDEQPVIRGRLLADRQILERFGMVDRLICRHDDLEYNVADNQLLAAALFRCGRLVGDPQLRRRARQLFSVLRSVCDPEELELREARASISYDRLNNHYRTPHELAWLILDGLGVEDVLAAGATYSFAFFIDMNQLFERFVLRLMEWTFAGVPIAIRYQRRDPSIIWDEDEQRRYTTVIPDILLHWGKAPHTVRLPVDAKYKKYDEMTVAPGDIYQGFLYGYAYGRGHSEAEPATAVLVYPTERGSPQRQRLAVRTADGLQAARLVVLGIPVAQLLNELGSDLASDASTIQWIRREVGTSLDSEIAAGRVNVNGGVASNPQPTVMA